MSSHGCDGVLVAMVLLVPSRTHLHKPKKVRANQSVWPTHRGFHILSDSLDANVKTDDLNSQKASLCDKRVGRLLSQSTCSKTSAINPECDCDWFCCVSLKRTSEMFVPPYRREYVIRCDIWGSLWSSLVRTKKNLLICTVNSQHGMLVMYILS